MSDDQKVAVTLHLLQSSSSSLLQTLQSPPPPSPKDDPLPLPPLYSDFLTLLTLIYTSTTKSSLALRPPKGIPPSPSAALAPLTDLTSHIATLTSNALAFTPHGNILASIARAAASDVIRAVRDFALALSTPSEDPTLRTAAVHAIIDRARADLPVDNVAAVRARWAEHEDVIGDVVSELAEEDDDGEGGFGDDEDEIDDELLLELTGGGSSSPSQRAFKASLHKATSRLPFLTSSITHLLSSPSPSTNALDALIDVTQPLSRALDDLAVLAYPSPTSKEDRDGPTKSELASAKRALVSASLDLERAVCDMLPPPPDGKEGEADEGGVREGSRTWFVAEFRALAIGVAALRWPEA